MRVVMRGKAFHEWGRTELTEEEWTQLLARKLSWAQRSLLELFKENRNSPIDAEILAKKKLPPSLIWGHLNSAMPEWCRLGKVAPMVYNYRLFVLS